MCTGCAANIVTCSLCRTEAESSAHLRVLSPAVLDDVSKCRVLDRLYLSISHHFCQRALLPICLRQQPQSYKAFVAFALHSPNSPDVTVLESATNAFAAVQEACMVKQSIWLCSRSRFRENAVLWAAAPSTNSVCNLPQADSSIMISHPYSVLRLTSADALGTCWLYIFAMLHKVQQGQQQPAPRCTAAIHTGVGSTIYLVAHLRSLTGVWQ